jgi:hypothetical protein
MSIDLGDTPPPTAANPTSGEAAQIRNAILATSRPAAASTDLGVFQVLTKYQYDTEPVFRPFIEMKIVDVNSGNSISIFPFEYWWMSEEYASFTSSSSLFDVFLFGTGLFTDNNFSTYSVNSFLIYHMPEVPPYFSSNCSFLTQVQIGLPNSNNDNPAPFFVEQVGNRAFYNCSQMSFCQIEGAKIVGPYAFRFCSSMNDFPILGGRLTEIKEYAFANSGLSSVDFYALGHPLSIIKASAFEGCISLINVTLPSTITTIGNNAFKSCGSLDSFYIYKNTPPIMGTNVFQSCPLLTSIHIPVGAEYNYDPINGTTWQGITLIADL